MDRAGSGRLDRPLRVPGSAAANLQTDPFAAFCTPCIEHLPAAACRHTGTEAVSSAALQIAGLKSSLHVGLFRAIRALSDTPQIKGSAILWARFPRVNALSSHELTERGVIRMGHFAADKIR